MSSLRAEVLTARERLAGAHEEFRRRHEAGCEGVELCAAVSDLRDAVVRDLFASALLDLAGNGREDLSSSVALVAHGGYGRREVAPYSDVDLMVLHGRGADDGIKPLAGRFFRDVFDASLDLGHSVRTPEQACRLAAADACVCTSLMEARLLAGDAELFERFRGRFCRQVQQRIRPLSGAIVQDRRKERARYGETVFLLEPNIKRSRGTLRDLQLLRWIGFVHYSAARPDELRRQEKLSQEDYEEVAAGGEFLLRLRNELHFHAGHAVDVLDRAEQLRIAAVLGCEAAPGILPVEEFMRDYFRHTSRLSRIVERFVAKAQSRDRVARLVTAALGHRVEGGVRVGPAGLMVDPGALRVLRGSLTEIMRLVALANLYDKPIAPSTWEVARREAFRLPDDLPAEARRRFVSLLANPARLGPLLRDLHEVEILERFIPEFEHARGLLQFNQYHKFTVDEHCLRAVEAATEMHAERGTLGRVYRHITNKHVLHLALLIHDLGKGFPQDHEQLGEKIAERAARRLMLPQREAEALKFLVRKHNLMNHLAFRRDTSDEQLVVRFAVEVGSPELLQMLYVASAADLAAVGPGVWDGWKNEILTELYRRTMQHLAAGSPAEGGGKGPETAAELTLVKNLRPGSSAVESCYLAETRTVCFAVATHEDLTPGVFHKLTGALSGQGLRIRSARINTLPDGFVLDEFWVHDPDYAGQPPEHRLEEVRQALLRSLSPSAAARPSFRQTWHRSSQKPVATANTQNCVSVDNSTSDQYTILDVFAVDRPGLLYALARTIFELGLSVWRAKIGTHLDQVVDVFYVTGDGRKIEQEPRLAEIRRRLLAVTESPELG